MNKLLMLIAAFLIFLFLMFKILPWWGSLLVISAGVVSLKWLMPFALDWIFRAPFRMKGKVLSGAMGTDIQYFAETWIGGQWKPAFGDFHNTEDDQELSHRNKFYFGGDRNYELLEILADTIDPRSLHTLRGFQPISSPRGIPADVSPVIGRLGAEDGTYRHSWLLLQELVDFPWHTTFRQFSGYVNAENFSLFKAGKPYQWDQLLPVPAKPILRGKKSDKLALAHWHVISNQEMEDQIQIGGHHRTADLQETLR